MTLGTRYGRPLAHKRQHRQFNFMYPALRIFSHWVFQGFNEVGSEYGFMNELRRLTEELHPTLENSLWLRVGLDVVYIYANG